MLEIAGRHADGWWPAGAWTPEQYAEMLAAVRSSAEHAGRDPTAITPCFIQVCLIGQDEEALAEVLQAPLVKAFLLQVSAETLRGFGFQHPMGEGWRGFQDIDPAVLTRERIIAFLDDVRPEMLLSVVPHGTPREVAKIIKSYVDAGLRVPKILDYGAMAGLNHAQASAANVRAAEDELMRLCGDLA
jgi:phthiodiolone/phenolphthiodiolone dimycocerosates ketoreductase